MGRKGDVVRPISGVIRQKINIWGWDCDMITNISERESFC